MLLNVVGLKKSYGVDDILTGVDFRIDRREKVALVGRNGTGKTTMLKIITGQLEPDGGSVNLARGAKIGYLKQEQQVDGTRTVLEEAEQARSEQLRLRARLEELEKRLDAGPTDDELEEYATLHEHYLEAEGYAAERDMRTVLQRMGFSEDELDKPAAKLSGGEKTRLALARLLLEQPDLLILDEPTNHLDLQATEWLENWLRGYPGAVLIVSHDRTFLENLGDKVLELRDGAVKSYPGSFHKFLKLKAEEEAALAELAKKQQHEMAKLDEYVRRFMNSQRTAQARGRLKMLEKMKASAVQVAKADKGMKAGFKAAKRSGDVVLSCEGLSFGYPNHDDLFRNVDWTVRNGERWGVIGENGAGKSTLIKVALGQLEPREGRARLGSNITLGYFAQDVVDLDPSQSPLDHLVYEFDLLPADARNLLGRFLIAGDDVFRPIRTLSGGEKNKLVLASLTTLEPNLLVLDEPTNHLDMDSREALAQVLREYKGTLILISHDRWLLRQVTDHTFDMRRDGVRLYPGSYGEYVASLRRQTQRPVTTAATTQTESPKLSPRELSKEIGRMEKAVAQAEDEVHAAEEALKALETRLAVVSPSDDIVALTRQHQDAVAKVDATLADWEAKSSTLDELRAQQ
ncbi:MAG: ABC-F family ATP-binding cassette domain-containing protein [Fimbriimonadales bacterium]